MTVRRCLNKCKVSRMKQTGSAKNAGTWKCIFLATPLFNPCLSHVVANLLLLHQLGAAITLVFGSANVGRFFWGPCAEVESQGGRNSHLVSWMKECPNSMQFCANVILKSCCYLLTLPDCWERQSFFIVYFSLVSGWSSPDFLGSFCSTSRLRLAQRHSFSINHQQWVDPVAALAKIQ